MADPKHTPGPWERGELGGSIVAHRDLPLDGRYDSIEEREAYGGRLIAESVAPQNVALICAAPDLLAALRDMVDRFAPDNQGLSEAEIACVSRARKAIAEAQGGHG